MNNQPNEPPTVHTYLVDCTARLLSSADATGSLQGASPIELAYLIQLIIRLTKTTENQSYLDRARYYADRLLYATSDSLNSSSHELTNFANALLELDRFLNSTRYYNQVHHWLSAATTAFGANDYSSNSFATGRAGLLMTLLQAYDYYTEASLLTTLAEVLDQLMNEAQLGEAGIYWDNGRNDVNFLCGFSHGNSGVGWVLAAVSTYFGQEAVGYVAQEAFRYEDAYFDPLAGNWPDWTKHITTVEQHNQHLSQYQAQNWSFFDGSFTNFSFESGLVGLVWARLHLPLHAIVAGSPESPVQVALTTLLALLAEPQQLTSLDGVTRVLLHRLCQRYLPHCVSLSADLLKEYLCLPSLPTLPLMQALYAGLSDSDDSFPPRLATRFIGNALLLPPLLNASGSQLAYRLIRRHFPYTTTVLDKLNANWWSAFNNSCTPLDFLRSRANWPQLVSIEQRPYVVDVIKLEDQLLVKRNSTANWALTAMAEMVGFAHGKNLLMSDDDALLNRSFCLTSEVTLVSAQWNWLDKVISQLPLPELARVWPTPNPGDWAIKCSSDKLRRVVIYPLVGFDSLLVEFVQPVKPQYLIEQLCEVKELLETSSTHSLRAIVLEKIKFFINEALISPS